MKDIKIYEDDSLSKMKGLKDYYVTFYFKNGEVDEETTLCCKNFTQLLSYLISVIEEDKNYYKDIRQISIFEEEHSL